MAVEARLWFAPGVEVFPGHLVPKPPPRLYCVAVKEPHRVTAGFALSDFVPVQEAAFRLMHYSPSGEVAHYDLEPYPRRGWRWLAINGRIHAERISP